MDPLNIFFHCTVDFIIFNHSNCYYRMHFAHIKWPIYVRGATMQCERWTTKNKTKQNGGAICKTKMSISASNKTNNECFDSCNGKNIFMR